MLGLENDTRAMRHRHKLDGMRQRDFLKSPKTPEIRVSPARQRMASLKVWLPTAIKIVPVLESMQNISAARLEPISLRDRNRLLGIFEYVGYSLHGADDFRLIPLIDSHGVHPERCLAHQAEEAFVDEPGFACGREDIAMVTSHSPPGGVSPYVRYCEEADGFRMCTHKSDLDTCAVELGELDERS